MLFLPSTIIAVTVAGFVLAAQTPGTQARGEGDRIVIPLTKHYATDAREFHATSHNGKIIRGPNFMDLDGSEQNTGTPHPSSVQQARDSPGTGLDLTKYVNGIWYGTILIGTPPRSFTVQLNTGFSDLFVPAAAGDGNCKSHLNLWDPASSEIPALDLNIDFTLAFADGRVASGKQYIDNVTIAGVTADFQTIGAASIYSWALGAPQFAPDGILGLGFPPVSQFHFQSPLLHTLFNEGKLSQPVFSLALTNTGGELYVGGTNVALYVWNTLVYTPVIHPAYLWQLMIDDIRVNGVIVVTNVPAIIDTGANFIYGELSQVRQVHKAASGGPSPFKGYWRFQCRAFPSVTFTIGGKPFLLSPDILSKGQVMRNSPNCFSGIAVADAKHTFWSLGTLFLEQFYTVFDFNSRSPRVGFAQLAH